MNADLARRLEFAAANTTMLSARPLLREAADALRWRIASEEMPPNFEPVVACLGNGREFVVARTSCVHGDRVWVRPGEILQGTPKYWPSIPSLPDEDKDAR